MAFNIEQFLVRNEEILRKSNPREMVFLCPMCAHRTGKEDTSGHLYVNRQTHRFFCQRCHFAGGNAQEVDSLDILRLPPLDEIKMPSSYVELMPRPQEDFYSLIRDKISLRELFKEKNFRWKDLQGWEFGYCANGPYKDRLIIPIYFQTKLVAFQGRALTPDTPKYKNRQSQNVFSQVLYNWDRALLSDHIVIVEGVFDAWRVGFNAVATLGTHLSKERIELINARYPKCVTVLFDADKAGVKASFDASRAFFPAIDVRFGILPKKRDPADMPRDLLEQCIAGAKKFNAALFL